jgi:putative ABC transport system substrate-binding protein
MRRLLTFLTILAFAVILICPTAALSQKSVGVMWVGQAGMPKRVFNGFNTYMKEKAPDIKVTLNWELGSMYEAEQVFQEYQNTKDAIVFLRSSGAKFLANATPTKPCFIGGCSDPRQLGVVQNLDLPLGNVTGVTYFIPYKTRFDLIMKLFPNTKSVALLLEEGHPNTSISEQGTREECSKRGIKFHSVIANNPKDLIAKTQEIANSVDLLIVSNTSLAMDNTVNLLGISNTTKTPIFSFSEKPVRSGAAAGMAADDEKLGRMLAESVIDVIVKGKPVSQVPIKIDPDPKIFVNPAVIQSQELSFPSPIVAAAVKVD